MRAYLRALDTASAFEQASPEYPPNIDLALTEKAKAILKGSGEKIPEEVMATVKDPEGRIGCLPFTQGTHVLGQWYNSIAERRGHLSQEGTAARFLFDREVFAALARGDTALINAAFRLCESWHWLSNEVTGAHALVVEGLGAMRGRASSAPARTSRKKLAQHIVTSEYVAYRDGLFEQARKEGRSAPHPGTYKVASTVAARISERVAACFKARGMEPYSELTLARALGPIIMSVTSLNTRPSVQDVSER